MKPIILVGARGFWGMKDFVDSEVFRGRFELVFDERVHAPAGANARVVALVVADQVVDTALLQTLPAVRTVARTGTGYDNVDMKAIEERNVVLTRVAKLNANSVSEFALGLIFNLLRSISQTHQDMLRGEWNRKHGTLLTDATVGIVGLGAIGQLLARKLHALGARHIIGWNRTFRSDTAILEEECGVEFLDVANLVSKSDVIVLALALTHETKKFIDRSLLARMKKTAVLVNTGRGALVDEEALAECLAKDRIGGAALDVFSTEPPTGSPFQEKFMQRFIESVSAGKNVILTPHNAGLTQHSTRNISLKVAQNIINVLDGNMKDAEIVGLEC